MKKKKERAQIPIEVEYTEGYEQRFTAAILKIYSKRLREEQEKEICREMANVAAG